MTVADYCTAMGQHKITINSNYQRSDKVWPPSARSFLIESILLGFPVPKFFLFQKTDLKSKETIKEIVDGQQRSKTLLDFFTGKLAISSKSRIEEAAGRKYDQLNDDHKGAFLNYQLSVDLFVSATPREIREAFRRLNSYTVPLNPEEKRHAEYQGEFKWFVHEISTDYEEMFLEMGVFGQKQIVRMQDTKLLTELVHALKNGIQTTKSKQLDELYSDLDDEFTQRKAMEKRITNAIDWLLEIDDIHNGPLMAPHIFYSLMLAVTHVQKPCDVLKEAFDLDDAVEIIQDSATSNLSKLADALESDPAPKKFETFIDACAEKTNVKDQRTTRFEWLCKALTKDSL